MILLFAFILGISVGSFVTLASHRIPIGKEIVFDPSHCPQCKTVLGSMQLIPLLSWIMQKGRCHFCKAAISMRYPVIELTLGITFLFVTLLYGVSWLTFFFLMLATFLAILIVTDLEYFIIPDGMQVAILLLGLAFRVYIQSSIKEVVYAMVFGLCLGLILHYGYLWFRKKDALGFGDVKFLCVVGAWLSFTDFVSFLFFSGVFGVLTGLGWRFAGRGAVFPFGPALALSLYINVLYPHLLQRMLM